jgi:Na+/H+ antiporter NhaC
LRSTGRLETILLFQHQRISTMKPFPPQTSTPRLRTLSHRVKVWTREFSTRPAAKRHVPTNPIYLIVAITLGIPALLAIPLIGKKPAIQPGAFTNVIAALVITAFVIAAIFEIKQLAEEAPDEDRH